ncbi:MAG TPA: hypothetical protein VD737_02145 [Steroidobacteraceae bacterium]|nr:hypothetical protein [Steroidobacteraceae bacterium]
MRIAPGICVALACLALPIAASAAGAAQAEPASPGHPGEHHAHDDASSALVSRLELTSDGRRWPTDAALRAGMANIRAAFEADHPAIHAGRQTDTQYDALASRIETEVNAIVAQCKLPPEADAQLHYVVGDLLQGVSLMRGGDPSKTRHDGAHRVHVALNAYGKYFDDPAWSGTSKGADPHAQSHEHAN